MENTRPGLPHTRKVIGIQTAKHPETTNEPWHGAAVAKRLSQYTPDQIMGLASVITRAHPMEKEDFDIYFDKSTPRRAEVIQMPARKEVQINEGIKTPIAV
jgi:hypothetical protein